MVGGVVFLFSFFYPYSPFLVQKEAVVAARLEIAAILEELRSRTIKKLKIAPVELNQTLNI